MFLQRYSSLILSILVSITFGQHILDDTCEFEVKLTNSTEKITFASQIHHISSRQKDVYINFCKNLQNSVPNCNPSSKVCIKNKRNKNMLKKPVTSFRGVKEFNNQTRVDDVVLITNDLGDCPSDTEVKYKFRVIIDMKKSTLENKIESDDCSIDITLPHPKVLHRECGFSYNGLIIDMRPIREFPEVSAMINGTQYIMAGCKTAPGCGGTSGLCEKSEKPGKRLETFSVAESQNIVYDERSNLVTIRGRKPGVDKTKSEVIVKCNWTENFGNLKKQLARYKYTVESRYGCVKVPLNCQITDIDNYEYDLSSLNKPNGWNVRNSTASPTKINICGTLKHVPEEKPCSDIFSQVCVKQKGEYLSYGALHNGLNFENDDIILTYTHGSTCKVNPEEYYSTRVTLKCHNVEMGPILTEIVNCTIHIRWQTPRACAMAIEEDSGLGYPRVMYDLKRTADLHCSKIHNGQTFKLASLMTNEGMTFESRTMKNVKYFVNICRSIAITRENYYCGVTGGCIEDGNEVSVKKRFKSFGMPSNPQIDNDDLVIHYNGGYCQNSVQREMVITFKCSQSQEALKLSEETPCRVDFTWNTPLACKSRVQRDIQCNISSLDDAILDLSNIEIEQHTFHAKWDKMNFTVNLCSNIIKTNISELSEKDGIQMTKHLIQKDCKYSIVYESAKNDCTSPMVNGINIDLSCNHNEHNDYIQTNGYKDCTLNLAISNHYVCKFEEECVAHALEHAEAVVDLQSSVSITSRTTDTSAYMVAPTEASCKVRRGDRELIVNALTAVGRMNYTIGGDAVARKCNGFICKNNVTLATLEVCPNSDVRGSLREVELTFSGPECLTGLHRVNVVLRCEQELETANFKVVKEQGCFTLLEVGDSQSCALFPPNVQASFNTGYIIGIIICALVMLISTIFVAWRYKQHKCNYQCIDNVNLCQRSDRSRHFENDDLYERNVQD